MKLTKNLRYIELDNQIYAVYNIYFEKVLYVNKTMLSNILLNKNLEKEDIKQLKKYRIYEGFFSIFLKNKKNLNFSNDYVILKKHLEDEYIKKYSEKS